MEPNEATALADVPHAPGMTTADMLLRMTPLELSEPARKLLCRAEAGDTQAVIEAVDTTNTDVLRVALIVLACKASDARAQVDAEEKGN